MSCHLHILRRLLSVVMLITSIAALIGGQHPAFAASGYWKYSGHQIKPTPQEYASTKPLPGHVYELRATGGFQAGPSDGKGSIDNYFKTDDVDRVQFLATSTLTFSAHSNLTHLEGGQKVVFEASLVIGGNDKSRAVPATGRATIAIDNGGYVIELPAKFGQNASARGEATIPNGGPGATMVIQIRNYLAHLGAMSPTLQISYAWVAGASPLPPPATPNVSQFGSALGNTLIVKEVAGGNIYDGTWTRRRGTDIFDAVWNGSVRDIIQIESVNGNQIVLYRHGNNGRYSGTLSADGLRITSGTASWYNAGWTWSGVVSGR